MPTGQIHAMSLLQRLLTSAVPIPWAAIGTDRAPLHELESAGCVIDDRPHQGVRLIRTGLGCWADYIEPRHANRIGRRISVYRQTTSTQDAARQTVTTSSSSQDGHVIVADHQTGGRGRLGRHWLAPPGAALLMTAIVDQSGASVDRLMLAAACSVAEAIEADADHTVQIRWPNDILVHGRKLAGILVETVNGAALVGIGVNVSDHPSDINATSLHAEHVRIDRLHLLDRLLDRLDFNVHHATDLQLLRCWRQRSCLIQQRVTVSADGQTHTGRIIDLDPAHGLLMQLDRGAILTLHAATTSLVV